MANRYWTDGSAAKKVMDYQTGSAAPVYAPAPEREAERKENRNNENKKNAATDARRGLKPRAEQNITWTSMIVLVAAIAITLYTCFGYLKVQADIVVVNKSIKSLEKELTALETRNDAAFNEIVSAVDFNEVYQVAVRDLGMVFPNKNETVSYEADKNGYVRQFGDIPESEKQLILKSLLH